MIELLQEIRSRLEVLQAEKVSLRDKSALHAGHAGSGGGGHFDLEVVATCFDGKRPLERHRMVYALLEDLIPARIHALSIKAVTPEE